MKCLILCEKKSWIEIFERLYKEHKENFSFVPEFYRAKYKVIEEKNKHYFVDLDFNKLKSYQKEKTKYYFLKYENFNDEKFKEYLENNYDYVINACEPDNEGDEAFELTLKDFNINIPTIKLNCRSLYDKDLLVKIKNLSSKLK